MNFEDYETLPTNSVASNMMAGAIAGIMEHCVMYPLDSVKTRMQSFMPNGSYRGIRQSLTHMIRSEGFFRPVRGLSAVVIGAGPSHALYFSSYEYLRDAIVAHSILNATLASGVSGCAATFLHDGIMTPTDAVKQRLQMSNSPYKSVLQCIGRVYRTEGVCAFYRSYTTQLVMNVPFQSMHFMIYEICQSLTNRDRRYNPTAHMISGAVAGGIAAAITTPLDVCKTLLNTQLPQAKVDGLRDAVKTIYKLGGPLGYFRGMKARILYQMPSTAICWSTYEFFKYAFTLSIPQKIEHKANCEGNQCLDTDNVNKSHSDVPLRAVSKKTCELPVIPSPSVYNALSFHRASSDSIVTSSTLMDVSRRCRNVSSDSIIYLYYSEFLQLCSLWKEVIQLRYR